MKESGCIMLCVVWFFLRINPLGFAFSISEFGILVQSILFFTNEISVSIGYWIVNLFNFSFFDGNLNRKMYEKKMKNQTGSDRSVNGLKLFIKSIERIVVVNENDRNLLFELNWTEKRNIERNDAMRLNGLKKKKNSSVVRFFFSII